MAVPRVWEVHGSNPEPAKAYTALQTVRHHNINASSCVAPVLSRRDGKRKLVTRFGIIRRVLFFYLVMVDI